MRAIRRLLRNNQNGRQKKTQSQEDNSHHAKL
jgi:hypothetical protein